METQNDGKSLQYQELCTECQTGVLHLEYLTYFTWLNEELVTVPNFPAWVCDVCGRREYDGRRNSLVEHPAQPRSGPASCNAPPAWNCQG